MTLLPVSHHQQRQQAECLAACAAMVLDYLQVPVGYERLVKLLQVGPAGAPFRNLHYLESLGLSVLIEQGEIATLQSHLRRSLPPLVFVDTGQLSYWDEVTGHAVVVIGVEEGMVYVNDPNFAQAPKGISIAEFELAWIDLDQFYATIELR
jgi:ABC-type bacteriocin/lantibiotic exporter with double-glycine peptidase domain